MAKLNDLTGKTFGNWKVLYRNGSSPRNFALWHCKCMLCGQEKDVVGQSLTSGASTKCRNCVPRTALTKPHRKERIYSLYTGIKQRCYDPNARSYKAYGGKGIGMCEEWKNSPDAFFGWAFSSGYTDDMTIERIDNDKGYSPNNCTWIPMNKQSANRCMNNSIQYKGNTYNLTEACRHAGVNLGTLKSYRKRHRDMPIQDIFDRYAKQ